MILRILIIISVIISVLFYLLIRGASLSKTDEERVEEDMQQLLFLKSLKEKEKYEKINNSRETECSERIIQNLKRMYED